jgi:hypothetical protein
MEGVRMMKKSEFVMQLGYAARNFNRRASLVSEDLLLEEVTINLHINTVWPHGQRYNPIHQAIKEIASNSRGRIMERDPEVQEVALIHVIERAWEHYQDTVSARSDSQA